MSHKFLLHLFLIIFVNVLYLMQIPLRNKLEFQLDYNFDFYFFLTLNFQLFFFNLLKLVIFKSKLITSLL